MKKLFTLLLLILSVWNLFSQPKAKGYIVTKTGEKIQFEQKDFAIFPMGNEFKYSAPEVETDNKKIKRKKQDDKAISFDDIEEIVLEGGIYKVFNIKNEKEGKSIYKVLATYNNKMLIAKFSGQKSPIFNKAANKDFSGEDVINYWLNYYVIDSENNIIFKSDKVYSSGFYKKKRLKSIAQAKIDITKHFADCPDLINNIGNFYYVDENGKSHTSKDYFYETWMIQKTIYTCN